MVGQSLTAGALRAVLVLIVSWKVQARSPSIIVPITAGAMHQYSNTNVSNPAASGGNQCGPTHQISWMGGLPGTSPIMALFL